jgi:uncharacterized protein YdhG (YjbR/CyaY superfamily)
VAGRSGPWGFHELGRPWATRLAGDRARLDSVTRQDVDAYLADLDEPKRSTLEEVRRRILAVVPDAEECISYGSPAFRVDGKVVAGFAAFKNHLSYLPHSGSVFPELEPDLVSYQRSTGALRFPIDEPLPAPLVRKLIEVRMRQLGLD